MAENKKKTINEAQNELIDDFVNSLTNKNNEALKSREEYRQVVNALAVDDAFTNSRTKNFLELLLKLLVDNKKEFVSYKEELLNNLKNDIEIFKKTWNNNGKKSYITYLNRFISFCETRKEIKYKKDDYDFKMDAAAKAAWEGYDNAELYLPNVLRTKFKSRLRCQDRTSGDKIWLPLRFIGKIYSEAKKSGDINENLFSAWLDTLVNSIYIHYEDPNNKGTVMNIPFEKGVSLLLKKEKQKDDKFQVYLIKTDDENQTQYPVLTPTGKGNQKVYMQVKSISDIAIDHVKSIDSTLRDLSKRKDGLKQLKIVSDKYKEIQMEDEPNEKGAVNKLLASGELNLCSLKEELDSIKNDGKLRLMSSKYNSQKSNGDTFQRIIKNDQEEYWGVLEEEENITDDDGKRVYYYQKLTNHFDSKDSFKVTRTKPDGDAIQLNEVDINII